MKSLDENVSRRFERSQTMIELKVSEMVASCLVRMIDTEISFQEELIVKEKNDGFNDSKTRQTIIKEMKELKENIQRKEDK